MNTPIGGRFVVPDIVATHFHIREGDIIADFGAGSGFFLKFCQKPQAGPGGFTSAKSKNR